MTLWQAIVLGVVQGLTEFLPISSTAHLRIVPAILGWNDPGAAFTAVIQLGTLAAVLLYFQRDIRAIVRATVLGIFTGKPLGTADAKLGWMIALGTVPVVVLGILLKNHIIGEFRSLAVISGALIGLAVILALAEWLVKRRERMGGSSRGMGEVGWRDAIWVGLAQAVALVPGSSRSGCTIAGGLFCGLQRETAARFSFLLSLPAILAAGVFELIGEREELLASNGHILMLLVSTVVSGVVGYVSIAFLLNYLKKHTMHVFIVYRLILGVGLLVWF
jgi:undecaprenyl-diphosphatase